MIGFSLLFASPIQANSSWSYIKDEKGPIPSFFSPLMSQDNNNSQDGDTGDTRLGAIQQSRLVAEDAETLDEFGWAVAISGNTAVIGSRNEDPDLGGGPIKNAGAAYIFVRSGNTWIQEAKLVAKNAKSGDSFGISVAIEGNTVVIGAPGRDSDSKTDTGAAFVFVREGNTWSQQAKLLASDSSSDDGFGVSVAIDYNTIVVGADGKDHGWLIDAGTAYVFIRHGSNWTQQARLLSDDAYIGDNFGTSVSISRNDVVIGATEANMFGRRGMGSAYLFSRNGNKWEQEVKLSAKDGRSGDYFGRSVSISGKTIVVGALFHDPDSRNGQITNAGAAYIFTPQDRTWKQQAMLMAEDASPFDQFGRSVAIFGSKVVVGATRNDWSGFKDVGAAYLFLRKGKDWEPQTKIIADQPYRDDAFGQSVAVYGDSIIIGANGRDPGRLTKAGEAFVYNLASIQLPATGFPPNQSSSLEVDTFSKGDKSLGNLWLELPDINIKTPIVGVPVKNNGWDVSWLWDQVGYMQGTAFPTWKGNTGIAGHVYLPNGNPGPFINLKELNWGDHIYIHAWGGIYVYEVREIYRVNPENLNVLSHKSQDWITLITCDEYDETSETFNRRLAVQAILIDVYDE